MPCPTVAMSWRNWPTRSHASGSGGRLSLFSSAIGASRRLGLHALEDPFRIRVDVVARAGELALEPPAERRRRQVVEHLAEVDRPCRTDVRRAVAEQQDLAGRDPPALG